MEEQLSDFRTYAVIAAGGIGARMGSDIPKQYLSIAGRPVIARTIACFALPEITGGIIVLTPQEWTEYTEKLLRDRLEPEIMERTRVIAGGSTRNETIMNAIDHIEVEYGLDDDPVIVTHDAVRPFVTEEIVRECIEAAFRYGASAAAIPATDTILESADGRVIDSIPDRSRMYQAQTPQCFRARELRDTYRELTDEERAVLTDAARIYVMKGKPVHLVMGGTFNIKITYPYDLEAAAAYAAKTDI